MILLRCGHRCSTEYIKGNISISIFKAMILSFPKLTKDGLSRQYRDPQMNELVKID